MAKATLESVCYQTRDLLEAMKKDWPEARSTTLRVDGGMTASDYTMQALADFTAAPVDRPRNLESTALGAAYLAGLHCGLLPEPTKFAKRWKREKTFRPRLKLALREAKYQGWLDCIRKLQA